LLSQELVCCSPPFSDDESDKVLEDDEESKVSNQQEDEKLPSSQIELLPQLKNLHLIRRESYGLRQFLNPVPRPDEQMAEDAQTDENNNSKTQEQPRNVQINTSFLFWLGFMP
jgi:hypothetical protein